MINFERCIPGLCVLVYEEDIQNLNIVVGAQFRIGPVIAECLAIKGDRTILYIISNSAID